MPTVNWNTDKWGVSYDWRNEGDEWSEAWGGTEAEWRTCIHPRLAQFLPATSIVELGPGLGRWAHYLLESCDEYIGVDLAARCVAACGSRFPGRPGVRFAVNDGYSLAMVPDHSVDLVFSFDSLVHAEHDVISAYLNEFNRILKDDGVSFIHHSNLGAYRRTRRVRDLLSRGLSLAPIPRKSVLGQAGLYEWDRYRGRSMSASRFTEATLQAGLVCFGQEVFNWESPLLTDCISLVARPGSKWDRPNVRVINRRFKAAAGSSRAMAGVFIR